MQLKHLEEYRQITIINESQNQEIISFSKKTEHDKETILKEKLINCCIRLVTVHGRPFELLEDEAFKEILSIISPHYTEIANTKKIKPLVTDKAYEIKDKISAELKGMLISLKMDSATCNDRQFIGINAQYMKKSTIVIRNLAILEMYERQTAENLKNKLLEVLADYRIPLSNIYSITTDNGANYLKIAKLLNKNDHIDSDDDNICDEVDIVYDANNSDGLDLSIPNINIEEENSFEIRSLPCAAHTLQLCIKDAFKKSRVSEMTIDNCRKAVKILRRPNLKQKINSQNLRKPVLDCPTRWVSTFFMLKSLIHLKRICNDCEEVAQLLNDDTWNDIGNMILCLEPSQEATVRLQSEKITLTDFYSIWLICKNKTERIHFDLAMNIVASMTEREKTLLANKAFLPAIFLDPRFKIILSDEEIITAKILIKDVYQQLLKVRPDRSSESQDDTPVDLAIPGSSRSSIAVLPDSSCSDNNYKADLMNLESILKETQNSPRYFLLDIDTLLNEYLSIPRLAITENALEFWSSKLPNNVLADLAQIILAAPATQVTVERLFSTLKFILTPLRNRLLDQTVKNIILIKCNQDLL